MSKDLDSSKRYWGFINECYYPDVALNDLEVTNDDKDKCIEDLHKAFKEDKRDYSHSGCYLSVIDITTFKVVYEDEGLK